MLKNDTIKHTIIISTNINIYKRERVIKLYNIMDEKEAAQEALEVIESLKI